MSKPKLQQPGSGEATGPRVLMVVEKLRGLGGAQKQAVRLARALKSRGVSVRIVTGLWRWGEPRREVVEGILVTSVFTAWKFLHLRGLRKLGMYIYLASLFLHLWWHRRRYDLIHVHSATSSAFVVALAGRWLARPTVMKIMASGAWGDLRRMRSGGELPGSSRMARTFLSVDRVICLNAEAEAECIEAGFRQEQRVPLPNGFPVREVEARSSYDVGSTIEVLSVGRLDPQKNFELLLRAVHGIAEGSMLLPLRVTVLGDGPERGRLETLAAELGLGERLRFLGRVNDVPVHLARADIFVLPSRSEGISNALLEAMAHGLPCIATAIPGNVDLVVNGETGLLVGTDDPGRLADVLRELATRKDLRERLGRAGRRLVEERFDMERIADRYADLYCDLTRKRGQTPSLAGKEGG